MDKNNDFIKEFEENKAKTEDLKLSDEIRGVSFLNIYLFYEKGVGVKKDINKAKESCFKSVELGNIVARATLYYKGWNKEKEKSFLAALTILKEHFDKYGDQERDDSKIGLHMCGFIYQGVPGVEINIPKAKECYEKAIKLGNYYSSYNLANLYSDLKEYDKTIELYEQSSSLGYIPALINLGFMNKNGEGIPKNINKAFKYFNQAIEMGDSHPLNIIAACYELGDGIEQDDLIAVEYFKRGCELNDPSALVSMAMRYEQGKSVEFNIELAVEYYHKAVEAGSEHAMFALGFSYIHGNGVEQNYEKALYYFEACIELGNNLGWYGLGLMHFEGLKFEKSVDKSIECLEKCVENIKTDAFNTESLLFLGKLYISKNPPNLIKATHYLLRGAIEKNENCAIELMNCLKGNVIEWKVEFQPFWPFLEGDNKKFESISTLLLLISKYRYISSIDSARNMLIKGVTMLIIKYIASSFVKNQINS